MSPKPARTILLACITHPTGCGAGKCGGTTAVSSVTTPTTLAVSATSTSVTLRAPQAYTKRTALQGFSR